jgi:hypothetical protein
LWYGDQVSSTVLDHLATAASALRVAITDTGSNTLEAQAIVAAARAIVDQAELICTRNIAIVKAVDVREDGHANLNAWLGATTNAWPSEQPGTPNVRNCFRHCPRGVMLQTKG